MKLLSINVSLPTKVNHNGKEIETSIYKSPTNADTHVSKLNVCGDKQADLKNHGGEHKAVYAFSANEYKYWENILKNQDMNYGYFGENLSILDMNESDLCIGDHLRIRDCLLEITQPRVPCFKLGIRANIKAMPRLFIEHAKTGFYMRVLEEGVIGKNDDVEIVRGNHHQLSVEKIFRSVFDKNFSDRDKIYRLALDIEALSDEWKLLIDRKLGKDKELDKAISSMSV